MDPRCNFEISAHVRIVRNIIETLFTFGSEKATCLRYTMPFECWSWRYCVYIRFGRARHYPKKKECEHYDGIPWNNKACMLRICALYLPEKWPDGACRCTSKRVTIIAAYVRRCQTYRNYEAIAYCIIVIGHLLILISLNPKESNHCTIWSSYIAMSMILALTNEIRYLATTVSITTVAGEYLF